MSNPGFALGAEMAERDLARKQAVQDQERNAQRDVIMNAGLPPEEQADAVRTLYAGNPSAFKQHIINAFGRLFGKAPQPTPMAYAPQSVTTQDAPMQIGGVTLPAPRPVTVTYPGAATQQDRLAQDLSAGKTRSQQALDLAAAQNRQALDFAGQKMDWVKSLPPDEQEQASRILGILPRPVLKNFRNTKTGEVITWNASLGSTPGPDWIVTSDAYPSSDMRARQDYQDYKTLHPEYTAPFEQWMAEQRSLGRAPMASPGVQYMRALVKQNSGQTLTPEESAAIKSYPDYVRQTSTIPGVARASAYATLRPWTVVNPDNPQQTITVTAGQAERQGLATPQSIDYQLNAAGRRALIPRNLGQNLASLQTAEDHLQMLSEMVNSLGNGNMPIFNAAAQRWAQETGNPAPVDFDTLKTALEGEMARAYTGVGATNQEIANVAAALDRANSPQQLLGALQTASVAMAVRRKNLWGQVQQATNGSLTPKGPAPRKAAAPSPPAAAPSKGPAPKKAATPTDDLNQRLQDAYGGQQQ